MTAAPEYVTLRIVVGQDLRLLRERLGLSQEALARLLGVAFATINRWENSSGASGPRGAVLSVLVALAEGVRRDPHLADHLAIWLQRGQPYMLHRLFALAYGSPRTAARRTR